MKKPQKDPAAPSSGLPPRLGGHIVLDLLNTLVATERGPVDLLAIDGALREWLVGHQIPVVEAHVGSDLVTATADLREAIRELIVSRLSNTSANTSRLNAYLKDASGYWQLDWQPSGAPRRVFIHTSKTCKNALAAIADAAACLLASRDFSAVKKCENPYCTMLFLDLTASRRRRWCDMATCGNRMKVAAFRRRNKKKRPRDAISKG